MKYCPCCGKQRVQLEGSVFVEDGPYDGQYANEGGYDRYRCLDCGQHFGPMPESLVCAKCGGDVYGEVGRECDYVDEKCEAYLCEDCMAKEKPEHFQVPHGYCPICGHYGKDCTGKAENQP